MARKLNAPEEIGGGSSTYLSASEPGWYLFAVTEAFEGKRQTKDGLKMMDGISIETEVVGGEHAGKQFTLNLWDPKPSDKDQGKSAAAKQAAFLLATDVISPADLGKEIEYETADSIGALFVAELVAGKPTDQGKVYLELNYSNIYHVDDPRHKVKFDEVQAARIADYQPEYRHDAAYFEKLTAKKAPAKKAEAKDLDFANL